MTGHRLRRAVVLAEQKTKMSVTASVLGALISWPVSTYALGGHVPGWLHTLIGAASTLLAGIVWSVKDDKGDRAS